MALTRITKGVIKPNENYDTHNINSTGIVTAIGLDVNGNGDISGNLNVGGVLTYEDVTSIDSVGIITAQSDVHVGAGLSVVGVGSFGTVKVGTGVTFETNGQGTFSGIVTSRGFNVSSSGDNGVTNSFIAGRIKIFDPGSQCQIQFGSGPSYSPHQKYASAMTYRTNAFTLQNTGTTRTALSWVNNDGPVNLWYTKGYAPDYSIKLSTTAKGITVGSGVTIETSGQANFAGITTISAGDLVVKPSAFPGVTSRIKLGYAEQLQFTVSSSNQVVMRSTGAYLQVASNTFNISRADMNLHMATFRAGREIELTHNYVNRLVTSGVGVTVYNQLDTTNLSIAGVSTFTGNIDAVRYGFSADTNTYITNNQPDSIEMTTGGVERFELKATNSGNSTVLTISDDGNHGDVYGGTGIVVHGSSGARIKFAQSNLGYGIAAGFEVGAYDGGAYLINREPQDIFVSIAPNHSSNPSELVRIKSTGSIGIGTDNPSAFLHLHKTSGDVTQKIESSNGAASLELRHTNGYGYIRYLQDGAETFRAGQIAQFTSYSIYNPSSSLPYQLCVEGNGEVGINTHNPSNTLHLLRNTNHGITLQKGGTNPGSALIQVSSFGALKLEAANNLVLQSGGSQQIIFNRGGTEVARFDTSGDMGLGTSTIENFGGGHVTLEVAGSTTSQGGVFKTATSDSAGTGSSGTEMIMFTDNTKGAINVVSSDPLTFSTANTERVRITSDGKVGIGEDAPQQKLHLHENSSNGNFMVFTNSTTGVTGNDGCLFGINSDEGGTIWNQENGYIRFGTSDTERLRINSDGTVTLGQVDSSSTSALHIRSVTSTETTLELSTKSNWNGSLPSAKISFTQQNGTEIARIKCDTHTGAANMADLAFWTNYGGLYERMRITRLGQVLVGNSASGFATQNKLIVGSGSGDNGITVYGGTSNNTYLHFADGNSGADRYRGYVNYSHSDNSMQFGTNDTEQVRIDSSGCLLVNTTSRSISSSELFEVKSTGSGFSHFRNNHSGYAPIYIDNEYTNTAMAPLITITDGGGNRAGLLLDPNSVFDITGQGGISFSTSGTVGNAIERVRVSNQGNIIYKDKDSGHTGGGRYSRTKTVSTSGDATTTFMRFTLDHGALAGMIFLTASNSGYSVAKTYAFAAQYGQTVTTNLLADTGAYSGANISFTSSTNNNQHNFMVQVSGISQEVNMTVILGNANQNVSYQEI